MSCLHVPVHVITVGDARCHWFKCNPIKLIKGQREQWMKPLCVRGFSRGFASDVGGFWPPKWSISVRWAREKTSDRVCTGHGKPGKSWNFIISFSRRGKSWNLGVGQGKSWKISVISMNERSKVEKLTDESKNQIKFQLNKWLFWHYCQRTIA